MLILSRKTKESIVIGKNYEIKVTVQRIKGDRVFLAIEAPKEVPIHRQEIYNAIQKEKKKEEEQE